jgi:hypothetical protein
MTGELGYGRKLAWPKRGIRLEGQRKPTRNLSTACDAEIRTEHLPNTCLEQIIQILQIGTEPRSASQVADSEIPANV